MLALPGFEHSQVVWKVVDATKYLDDDRNDAGLKLWLELREGHLRLPADAFAIVFNQNVELNACNYILPGFIWGREVHRSFGETVAGKHDPRLFSPPPRG